MITDLSDLIDQLEDPTAPLVFEIDPSHREALHTALLLGLKLSLQHPASQASPEAMITLNALQVMPTGANAYLKRLAAFEYKDQRTVAALTEQMSEACGWLEYYCNEYEPSRQYQLSMRIRSAIESQPEAERTTLPLSWVHEAADWVEGIQRNDTQHLGQEIRKDVLEFCGISVPAPLPESRW